METAPITKLRPNHVANSPKTEDLIRQARQILGDQDIAPGHLHRICRRFHDSASSTMDFATYLRAQVKASA
jgi:hypothetical protein